MTTTMAIIIVLVSVWGLSDDGVSVEVPSVPCVGTIIGPGMEEQSANNCYGTTVQWESFEAENLCEPVEDHCGLQC